MDKLILQRWLELMVLAEDAAKESGDSRDALNLYAFVPAHYFTGEEPLGNSVRFVDILGRRQLWLDHEIYGLSDLFIQETI